MGLVPILLVGWALTLLYRLITLTDDCFDHVKEHIRADQHAGHRSIRAQERASRRSLTRPQAGGLYQPTAVTPASALRHVVLLPSLLFVVAPTRRHVRGAIIHWTAFVSYPSNEWLQELRDSVAHFLGLSTHEVELRSVSTYRKFARIVRT